MEKLTFGLESEFQAHVAMWLLFYKNAQEKVLEAARPRSSASCPSSAQGHRQENTAFLPKASHTPDRGDSYRLYPSAVQFQSTHSTALLQFLRLKGFPK